MKKSIITEPTVKYPLLDLVGVLIPKEAKELGDSVKELNKRMRKQIIVQSREKRKI